MHASIARKQTRFAIARNFPFVYLHQRRLRGDEKLREKIKKIPLLSHAVKKIQREEASREREREKYKKRVRRAAAGSRILFVKNQHNPALKNKERDSRRAGGRAARSSFFYAERSDSN